ncbi:penicillin-binding transpeptidase domain-containing protein [Nonomuraea sp. NEAU-A123]|uniref:penicillin-binding transpeptidase domain-containing protein n=1 Tax=Nonomuraea sp. NEAU-A123 TaxID=2839649 RepID=UPI0027E125F8|nr:penicillin-binding transpeptidase domain-containing protein [Nonomuraea sp. NEAU-A123]
MRETGGRGQGPGRGGAGSQGGPGAARRTPGGPGRQGRQAGSARSEGAGRPDNPPKEPRKPDPLDLPFGPFGRDDGRDDAEDRARRPQDPADGSRGRGRGDESDGPRSRSRGDERDGSRDRPRDGDASRGRSREDEGSRGRSRSGGGDGVGGRPRPGGDGPRWRSRPDGDDAAKDRARQRSVRPRPEAERPGGRVPQARDDRSRGRQDDGPLRRTREEAPRDVRRSRDEGRRDDARLRRTGDDERTRAQSFGRRGGEGPPRRPPAPPRPPKPPPVLRLGNPRRRINIGLIGMTFILSIFGGRLIQMQGLDSKVYEARAVGQRTQTEDIPAKRGTITDVKGHALAVTVEAREIAIDPTKIKDTVRAKVAALLATQLGRTPQEMAAKLARVDTRYQLLARDVDPVVASRLLKSEVPALTAKKTYRRVYPGGDLAGSLIGFVGDEQSGLGGIEQARNTLLKGRDGEQRVETGRDGQRIPMTSSQRTIPVDGADVRLTIDRDIQWAAQQAVAQQVTDSAASSGTVIVMDVRTAQIVAMANAPELDLNNWRNAPATQYINRAASDVFEPGSTNKVITAAATLEAGAVTPDTVFQVKDNIRCADRVLHDAHPHKPEPMTYRQAVAESSNVATIMAARKVGSERLYQMLKAFGFGAQPGGGVPNAEAGLLPNYKNWSGSQSCTIAYGQGVSVTALQMASVYQTIANGGVKIEPQIVAGTTDTSGRFVPSAPGKKTRVVSDRTAKEITTMLETAVSAEGTGELAAIPGYRVAGKTGTANRYDAQLGRYDGYTASFAGFAPADAPRLVVLSVLQNPKKDHFGGLVAAPVFKDVMTFAIKSKKIPPTGSTAPAVRAGAGQ